jgi:hypothetical protein
MHRRKRREIPLEYNCGTKIYTFNSFTFTHKKQTLAGGTLLRVQAPPNFNQNQLETVNALLPTGCFEIDKQDEEDCML